MTLTFNTRRVTVMTNVHEKKSSSKVSRFTCKDREWKQADGQSDRSIALPFPLTRLVITAEINLMSVKNPKKITERVTTFRRVWWEGFVAADVNRQTYTTEAFQTQWSSSSLNSPLKPCFFDNCCPAYVNSLRFFNLLISLLNYRRYRLKIGFYVHSFP